MGIHNNSLIGSSGQQGYQISRSVRLRSSASASFSRTFTTPTNGIKYTWSGWVKRGTLGTEQGVFCQYTSNTDSVELKFLSTGELKCYVAIPGAIDYSRQTTQVFRDPSAWYHIVFVYDSANATSDDRIIFYINGTRVTVFTDPDGTIPQNNVSAINTSGRVHYLGYRGTSTNYLDGYLGEINFIDGQALTPSSFGETNSITGVWQPKKYAGTYGTNGFYLNFSDNSASTAAAIGKDYSGNGNNWTPNVISVTAGATYDSMLDVPTPYVDGGNGRGNYCTVNPLSGDYGTFTLSNANLTYAGARTASATAFARSTIGVSSGKWYWEAVATDVGVGPNLIVGVQDASTSATTGSSNTLLNGYGYNGGGFKYDSSGGTSYGATWTNGDVIGVAFDLDAGTITFYKNNVSQGTAYSSISGTYCPVIAMTTAGVARTIAGSINFGQRPFTYTPPSGFVALNTQNLPASTIFNGANQFVATTYTGDGTASRVISGLNFTPDFIWIKNRSSTWDNILGNYLATSASGTPLTVVSNSNAIEVDGGYIGAQTTNSLRLAVSAAENRTNGNTLTYVGWAWNAGGSTVTNTSGSISAQVRANPTAGFSVVTYTGTGANATVGHGLGVAPRMMIVKKRTGAVQAWGVYHASLANTQYLVLDTTAGAATLATMWNSTSANSSVFSIGTDGTVNTSTAAYVAYCFSAVAGYSAFGSYAGNNLADGPFVYLGFRPRWVMFKDSSTTSVWMIMDTARNTYNVLDDGLAPNNANAESTYSNIAQVDFLSNGFKIRAADAQQYWNNKTINSNIYIYAAFAENPFKNSLAR